MDGDRNRVDAMSGEIVSGTGVSGGSVRESGALGAGAGAGCRRGWLEATEGELGDWLSARGERGYRARQVNRWIFEGRAESFEAMTDLPKGLRSALDADWTVFRTRLERRSRSSDGTEKFLLGCADGRRIECVLMREGPRRTVCISSQVGCGMGCVFCASGLRGVERNLSSGEIVEEVLRARNALPAGEELTNIVVMGMGESLANLENLIGALDRICSPEGLGLSERRVTISTVGLPEKMRRLAELDRRYHLAVSLHAATAELRDRLVPVNRKVGLDAVMDAADGYFARTGRQVTYEYAMLRGINDRLEDARALVGLLRNRKGHVNLIPYNPVEGLPYESPRPEDLRAFVETARRGGLSVTVRKTKGRPIDAACGQLRRRAEAEAGSGSGSGSV